MRDRSVLENLKQQKIWFCWKLENRKDSSKPTKVPYSAISGLHTGTDEKFRNTWTDYDTAYSIYQKKGYSGVGFKIPKNIGFLDIDHVGTDNPIVKTIQEKLSTYAETSQSGNGVHFYFYIDIDRIPTETVDGKLTLSKKYYQKHPTNGMELYFGALTNRYAAFTGNALNDFELRNCHKSN